MDKIKVYNEDGQEIEKEIVLLMEVKQKTYILFRDIEGAEKKLYAAYFLSEQLKEGAINLFSDLSENEYNMLGKAYDGGKIIYENK